MKKFDTNEEIVKASQAAGKKMLFFSADWCPDCRFIKPAMPEIEAEYPDYDFIYVDRDDNIDVAQDMGVFGIPSFIAFANGKETGRFVNKDRKTKQEVESFINGLPA
ncbi:thioredoxin family protein [Lacticaseibacillus nasuensis]|uniref:Thiol-disulfide isomerase and thioredoxin n=1 Tax=Lacticaseibacillus nasuensis JCM 17158 TaxID=1291734 RepID=A0A0R1JSF4_9LACO|nr:thioredoxin family protein [Lacticaseibacillus nasuensis]KRK74190.1 Thiol-disulfide isomerase and thioredoxin [Lacticaseibacillus nasuensis JCM 17158]MCX2455381.1 thioredoxin family protein [Lacticaseibacillus nasuensis]